jgi:hypothetical protein
MRVTQKGFSPVVLIISIILIFLLLFTGLVLLHTKKTAPAKAGTTSTPKPDATFGTN